MKKEKKIKKPWVKPDFTLLASGYINNGNHPAFHEIGPGATPLSFVISRNTPVHKVYHSSANGWNYAAHS